MSDLDLNIRRAVVQIAQNKASMVACPVDKISYVTGMAERFARSRRIGIAVEPRPDGVEITYTGTLTTTLKYGEIDRLAVGESHLFRLPVAEHQSIRSSVTYHSKRTGKHYRCTAEDGALRVFRLPVTDDERARCEVEVVPVRTTKFAMERLADVPQLRFDVPRCDQDKVRMAAFRASVKHGWTIRCQVQPDGAMLAFRPQATDDTEATPQPSERTPSDRGNLFDLERLADPDARLTFNLPPSQQMRLRNAVHRKAVSTGWRIRCRIQDDGSMLVYRVVEQAAG